MVISPKIQNSIDVMREAEFIKPPTLSPRLSYFTQISRHLSKDNKTESSSEEADTLLGNTAGDDGHASGFGALVRVGLGHGLAIVVGAGVGLVVVVGAGLGLVVHVIAVRLVVAVVVGAWLGARSRLGLRSRLDMLAVLAVDVADDELLGVLALGGDLPAAVLALAHHVVVALVGVALLADADAVVADNLAAALVALALGVVALAALADDELVPVLGVADLGAAVLTLADDAVVHAVRALAGVLGGAKVAAADNLLGVPLGGGADGDRLGDDVVRLLASGAVGHGRGARGDGADVGAGDGGGAGAALDALVDGDGGALGDGALAHAGAAAHLLLVAGAGGVALALVLLLGGARVNLVTAEAVPVGCGVS